jgi:nicotinamide-nucleotide amidase
MTASEAELTALATQLGECLQAQGIKLASAESCTGGWLAKVITDIAGSSTWFAASVVSYSNQAKHSLLGVRRQTLAEFGAVSCETVLEMSEGVFNHTEADVAVSISGIAGPEGGSAEKPVGLVWMSWGIRGQPLAANAFHFDGDREAVRRQAVKQAMLCLMDLLVC